MNISEFEAHRHTVKTTVGDLSYVDVGEGPPALFVHGVFLNAHLWRNVIAEVQGAQRCIAIDLPAHGHTVSDESWDLSLGGLAAAVLALCDSLGLEQVDVVANDTGGAVAQIFVANHPERVRTFALTNCDTQGNIPPPNFAPVVDLAREGGLAPIVKRLASDFGLARSNAGFALSYERIADVPDEQLHVYLAPLAESDHRARELERCVAQLDEAPLLAIEPLLQQLNVPTLLVWGTDDPFFGLEWAEWLRDTIPGANEIVEIEGGRLFFPDERPGDLAPHLLRHWKAAASR